MNIRKMSVIGLKKYKTKFFLILSKCEINNYPFLLYPLTKPRRNSSKFSHLKEINQNINRKIGNLSEKLLI